MSKFAIAFIAPTHEKPLRHRVVEGQDRETALRSFFEAEASEYYSADDKGFYYFKEDFFDEANPGGSILVCD